VADAIAVENGKLIYMGDSNCLKNFMEICTDVINLKGKMVLPG
jgi:predicted amidohydrolase YtcJ